MGLRLDFCLKRGFLKCKWRTQGRLTGRLQARGPCLPCMLLASMGLCARGNKVGMYALLTS